MIPISCEVLCITISNNVVASTRAIELRTNGSTGSQDHCYQWYYEVVDQTLVFKLIMLAPAVIPPQYSPNLFSTLRCLIHSLSARKREASSKPTRDHRHQ